MKRAGIGVLLITLINSPLLARTPFSDARPLAGLPSTTIEVSGIIVDPPPCVINNDKPVDVEFDVLLIDKVNGDRYSQPIPVEISCPDTFKGEIKLAIGGTASDFNINALATNRKDFALLVVLNEQPMTINQFYDVNWRQHVALKAVPLINPHGNAEAGEFSASATLMAIVN